MNDPSVMQIICMHILCKSPAITFSTTSSSFFMHFWSSSSSVSSISSMELSMISWVILGFMMNSASSEQNISSTRKSLTVGYTIPWMSGWPVGQEFGSSFVLGLEEVSRRQILPDYNIDWIWRDTLCEPQAGWFICTSISKSLVYDIKPSLCSNNRIYGYPSLT